VAEVAQAVKLSRRSLEVRFRAALGRSIRAEIERVRLEHARSLLGETDLPTSQVAELCGFGSPSYLALVFRRKFGRAPTRYREEARRAGRRGAREGEGFAQF
jgi:LacI family transcriptional regulator